MLYDVVIAGGGTAGCAAAYTAGRLGLKTLLIEKRIHLGGSITSGLVIPAMQAGQNQINTDFFNNLTAELRSIGGQVTYMKNQGWFNPELTKIVLDKMMTKANADVLLDTEIQKAEYENRRITRLFISSSPYSCIPQILSLSNEQIQNPLGILSIPIETRYVIDATGNCEVAKLCGCELLGNLQEQQPVSLRFMMSGVDVEAFGRWLLDFDTDRNVTTVELIDGVTHLSTAYTWDSDKEWALKPLFDDAVAKNILEDRDRNYFQIFTTAGMPSTIAFNCPRVIEDRKAEGPEGRQIYQAARESILRLSNFCKEYFPGFEKAYISNIADMLGVRVSQRIKGKYVYTIDDLKSGKKFTNPVVTADYPVDVHSSERDKSTLHESGEYQLPIESLMSADFDNLFAAGRCLSADFLAQGALRVQPSCFAMGEGVAKYIVELCK
ncbi:MAG: FAD-dependent oxidoreductase [Heliobacteriaceae bacterium]|jgi:ribulose 1,5-bisphosphate synthetase/thiazole synthase|nr:FAD-dependent oxidoreductase [Heliobacteriaceae bacterium]